MKTHLRFRAHEHSRPCCARAHTALPSLLYACTFPVTLFHNANLDYVSLIFHLQEVEMHCFRKFAPSPSCQRHNDEVLKELLIDYSTVARVRKEATLFKCYAIRTFF
jgi:hypothetical protein